MALSCVKFEIFTAVDCKNYCPFKRCVMLCGGNSRTFRR